MPRVSSTSVTLRPDQIDWLRNHGGSRTLRLAVDRCRGKIRLPQIADKHKNAPNVVIYHLRNRPAGMTSAEIRAALDEYRKNVLPRITAERWRRIAELDREIAAMWPGGEYSIIENE